MVLVSPTRSRSGSFATQKLPPKACFATFVFATEAHSRLKDGFLGRSVQKHYPTSSKKHSESFGVCDIAEGNRIGAESPSMAACPASRASHVLAQEPALVLTLLDNVKRNKVSFIFFEKIKKDFSNEKDFLHYFSG